MSSIEVVLAEAQDEPVLATLLELYSHDFGEFYDIDLDADGRYGYRQLPQYWSDPGRHPLLVRRYWRRRLGLAVAHDVWRRFPGRWEVRVMPANQGARLFWERAIREFAHEAKGPVAVEKDGTSWQLFTFDATTRE